MKVTTVFKPATVQVDVKTPALTVGFGTPIKTEYVDVDLYTGAYSITPTQEEQVFDTTNKRLTQDLVVGPIPSNYGRITWNGSVITVS